MIKEVLLRPVSKDTSLNFEFVLVSTENWDPQFNQVLGKDSNRDKQTNTFEATREQGSLRKLPTSGRLLKDGIEANSPDSTLFLELIRP